MKKREDAFLGIHFDFHAQEGQTVGTDYRPEAVAELLDRVKPDYVQCDTKGHYGYASYPTQVGTPPTGLQQDVLQMWRELTKARDIALCAHHSGLFDMAAAKAHPDWAVVHSDGQADPWFLSAFGPYAEEYMIPQLKELALQYDLDGAWIDGECWGAFADYSTHATQAYKAKFGKEPPRPEDPDFEAYRDFCRVGFEDYVTRYVQALKTVKPDFAITSNWIYSSQVPDAVRVPVDFLSGDLAPENAVESARHEARCMAARNKPWDLMAWGHSAIPSSFEAVNRSTKEYAQYCQEAAMVIALGGGFQFFNIMYGTGGTVQPWAIPLWEKVADFCRQREFCHKAKPVHQVGVVYPTQRPANPQRLYTKNVPSFFAMCSWDNALLESGFSTEVIFQSELAQLQAFPVVVLPDGPMLEKDIALFKTYVEQGGRLIVDLGATGHFADFAGMEKEEEQTKLFFLAGGDALAAVEGTLATFTPGGTVTAQAYMDNYVVGTPVPLALCKQVGKGNITFMALDFAKAYENNVTTAIRTMLCDVVTATGFVPAVTVSGSSFADLVVTEKEGKWLVNIINTAGPGGLAKVRSYNEIPPIGPLTVRIRKAGIQRIVTLPGGENIPFRYADGCCEFVLPKVDIHTVAVVDFQ